MKTINIFLIAIITLFLVSAGCKTDEGMPEPNRCGDPSVLAYSNHDYDFIFGNADGQLSAGNVSGKLSGAGIKTVFFVNNAVINTSTGTQAINNCLVFQTFAGTQVAYGDSAGMPAALIPAINGNSWCSINRGQFYNDSLELIVSSWKRTGPGAFDFVHTGVEVVVLNGTTFQIINRTPVLSSIDVLFGSEILNDDAYTYIYGARNNGPGKDGFVARIPRGSLLQTWEFFDGQNWGPFASARPTHNNITDYYSVFYKNVDFGKLYYMVSQTAGFGQEVALYKSISPTGGWELVRYLYCRSTADNLIAGGTVVLDAGTANTTKLVCTQQLTDKDLQTLTPQRPVFIEFENWE